MKAKSTIKGQEEVQLNRDYNHARVLYWLADDLKKEKKDNIYTVEEKKTIEKCIRILHDKEIQLKTGWNLQEWNTKGDYTLWR